MEIFTDKFYLQLKLLFLTRINKLVCQQFEILKFFSVKGKKIAYLSSFGSVITACVVHSQYPAIPIIQFGQFEIWVALSEGSAFS